MTTYVIGQVARLTVLVTADGVPVAPSVVSCTVELPDGTQQSPSTSTSVTGTYTADFTTTIKGAHVYRFASSGSHVGAVEASFDVAESSFV